MHDQNDWWLFHLTPTGWTSGTCRREFRQKIYIEPPRGVVLTRRYHEKAGTTTASPVFGFEELDTITQKIKELLAQFPCPDGYECFHEVVG